MSARQITLEYGDELELVLPDGETVCLTYEEPGKQLPELDIVLPKALAVNHFGENLAKVGEVTVAKQLIMPLPLKEKWVIHDWAGNHLFRRLEFATFEDGWDFIRTQFPDDEESWQEYYVVPKPYRE